MAFVFLITLVFVGISSGTENVTESQDPPKTAESAESELVDSDINLDSVVEVDDVGEVREAKRFRHIVFKDLHVPEGLTLDLTRLKPGTLVEFAGTITFGYKEWKGYMVRVTGTNVTLKGLPGHVFDCQGDRWWDGLGEFGKPKPKFIYLNLSNSTLDGLIVKNTPARGFSVNRCVNLNITNVVVDNADGLAKGGANNDAFMLTSNNVRISNCSITGPYYCLLINSGADIIFENNVCSGGDGIAIGGVGGRTENDVRRVTVRNCRVVNSKYGIHVKTVKDATGSVENVTFVNVELVNIAGCGVKINGNYKYPKSPDHEEGDATPGVPITGLTIKKVRGSVVPSGANVCINVANASEWIWESEVTGGQKVADCKGVPEGVTVPCKTE